LRLFGDWELVGSGPIACLIDANKVIRGELKKTNRREAKQGGRRRRCRRRNVSMGDHGIQPLQDEIKKEKRNK
jgi:hypothetical protein